MKNKNLNKETSKDKKASYQTSLKEQSYYDTLKILNKIGNKYKLLNKKDINQLAEKVDALKDDMKYHLDAAFKLKREINKLTEKCLHNHPKDKYRPRQCAEDDPSYWICYVCGRHYIKVDEADNL